MRIKVLSEARAQIAPLQESQDATTTTALDEAVKEAASVDGDRVLDQFEAQAIRQAYDSVAPQGGALSAQKAGEFKSAVGVRIQQLKTARAQSTEVLFTSEGQALEKFRARIIGSIQETIDKAQGKKVDVNMMVFAFTDAKMADAVVDMAKKNPNVTFRLLTDWSQLATSGGRQPPRLVKLAKEQNLTNLVVKYKKDSPYGWDDRGKRPKYLHSASTGLNHHKGFVTLIEGVPQKMTFGSFNWSVGGMASNYENLMVLDRADADNRPIMAGYQQEFEAFWNHDEVALTPNEAVRHKESLYASLYASHNEPYEGRPLPEATETDPVYDAKPEGEPLDINSLSDAAYARLKTLLGSRLAGLVVRELREYGRFDGFTELVARVPELAAAPTWAREQLTGNLEYGDGGLSINNANASELKRAGLSISQARALVEFREKNGAFDSLDELHDVVGIAGKTLARVDGVLQAEGSLGVYSARVPGEAATTGWAEEHRGTLEVPKEGRVEAEGATGNHRVPANRAERESLARNLAAPVADMLRRAAPGQTLRLAMYGMSRSSQEFQELKKALERGVALKAVLYNAYNDDAVSALKELKAQGLDVDVRIISSRVMHEKFGVVGDDCFNGSANWSGSSITRNSEDRFYFRNQPQVAHRFVEEFARLWERSRQPA